MDFKECNTEKDYIDFFNNDDRAYRHTNYYHYTSLENVDKMLSNKQIRLTALSKTANDNIEKALYIKYGNNLFSLCFSTGTSESLPLWYLYSGIDGKGARIEISKKNIKTLISQTKFYLIETEDSYPFNKVFDYKPVLLNDDNCKILFRDILYIGRDSAKPGKCRIKYNGSTKNEIDESVCKAIKRQYERFTKTLIWFYEKETRLQVEIIDKNLIDNKKNYVVIMDLSPIYDEINIRLAPEFEGETEKVIEKYGGVKQLLYSKLQKSDYAGQIKMNLSGKMCRNCTVNNNINLEENL